MQKFVSEIIHGTVQKRSNEGRLTGEWLIFAKGTMGNIYLCMENHSDNKIEDQNIFNKLAYTCELQFPTLEPFASQRGTI